MFIHLDFVLPQLKVRFFCNGKWAKYLSFTLPTGLGRTHLRSTRPLGTKIEDRHLTVCMKFFIIFIPTRWCQTGRRSPERVEQNKMKFRLVVRKEFEIAER